MEAKELTDLEFAIVGGGIGETSLTLTKKRAAHMEKQIQTAFKIPRNLTMVALAEH